MPGAGRLYFNLQSFRSPDFNEFRDDIKETHGFQYLRQRPQKRQRIGLVNKSQARGPEYQHVPS